MRMCWKGGDEGMSAMVLPDCCTGSAFEASGRSHKAVCSGCTLVAVALLLLAASARSLKLVSSFVRGSDPTDVTLHICKQLGKVR